MASHWLSQQIGSWLQISFSQAVLSHPAVTFAEQQLFPPNASVEPVKPNKSRPNRRSHIESNGLIRILVRSFPPAARACGDGSQEYMERCSLAREFGASGGPWLGFSRRASTSGLANRVAARLACFVVEVGLGVPCSGFFHLQLIRLNVLIMSISSGHEGVICPMSRRPRRN